MGSRRTPDSDGADLTGRIIACVIRVHEILGPGFQERIYRRAMLLELRRQGLPHETEREVLIEYDGHNVGRHRIDIIVGNEVILELKAVNALHSAHYAQVRSYLKASGLRTALLVNFATHRADFRRVDAMPARD